MTSTSGDPVNGVILFKSKIMDGKVLGCWCKPRPCHGDVYVKVVNRIKLFRLMGKSFVEHLRQTYGK
ncbi:ribonucleoside-diphosphate reductase subunit [Klebsiella phage May]|uniref:Ribonucleoside-diphosphate reductase subunit n=1 Tax=Klebsiella phage May TaxID=2054272 RepID=A0A2H5BNY0_9CAUD|nr:ribonucleoside-diphosphate reductase subunit [Klebsiella phage May]AUG88038.1 ribonucleoside-diphosphate reductase subunit [Klebsiella phage May]